MISESYYWKKELYNCFRSLAKFRQLKRITELSCVKIEKSLMIGAYIVRKLDEAKKIPPDFLKQEITVSKYECKMDLIDHMNRHRVDSNYNFEKLIKEKKNWIYLLNQIIHSFSFCFCFDNAENEKLDGFFLNSDKTKIQGIYFVRLESILYLFLKISEGDITRASLRREKIGSPMELRDATYSYPESFDINKLIKKSMDGEIYNRLPNSQRM